MNNLTVLVVFILTVGAVCTVWFVVQGLVKASEIQVSIVNLLTKQSESPKGFAPVAGNFGKEQRHVGHLAATE
jgi:hypothetical protein